MKFPSRNTISVLLSLAAGFSDLATGCMLVAAPLFTLHLMGVQPRDPAMTSFVGAFVGAVGFSYLWGLAQWRKTGSPVSLREVWRVTAFVRFAAGMFSSSAILRGGLEAGWWSVPAWDVPLAVIQLTLISRGWLGRRE